MISAKVDINQLKDKLSNGDIRTLARALTLVENDISPAEDLLKSLHINRNIPVIGITGPPGAGKSTLVNSITNRLCELHKKVAILAVDPTSPFNYGSLLGDRIRMLKHFNQPNVYIRSVATRGSLGGVSGRTLEMIDVLRSSDFDLIIVETVGVGQSEIEIAGLADQTILVLVPEAGDEIQHIKSGLMEVAQAFVVNKADREGADSFANSLRKMIKEQHQMMPVFKTTADKDLGIDELCHWILNSKVSHGDRNTHFLVDQAIKLIQNKRMKGIEKAEIFNLIKDRQFEGDFNMYRFVEQWM